MDNILALIGRAHQGDKRARDILTRKIWGWYTALPQGLKTEEWRWKTWSR